MVAILLISCNKEPKQDLQTKWVLFSLSKSLANAINDIPPTLQINLTRSEIFGYDGCNEYTGTIIDVTGRKISFGDIVTTSVPCSNVGLASRFSKSLEGTKSYSLQGKELRFFDRWGSEIMAFMKED